MSIIPCLFALLILCFFPERAFSAGAQVDTPASAGPSVGTLSGENVLSRGSPPADTVFQKWMDVETELLLYVKTEEGAGLLAALNDFGSSVDSFLHSPLSESGAVTDFSQRDITQNMAFMTDSLIRAVREGQTDAAPVLSGEIRRELSKWQYLDSGLADHIHMAYFSQFLVFLVLIIVMTLLVWRLYLALENSRVRGKQSAAFSRQMVLAQEEERSRIARELHDSVAQELSVLGMKVSAISQIPGGNNAGIQEICKELSSGHEDLIDRVRGICNDLIPPEFRHQGLADALRRLCYDFEKTVNIPCRITIQDGFIPDPLPMEMQLQCFRLVQEALSNIRKHAEASEATVLLRKTSFGGDREKPGLLICISDDGKGFTTSVDRAGSTGHLGIRGMYERISILGGALSFISEENEGTMVKIEVPLK